MTFADARQNLNGSQTTATDYFRGKTTERLMAAFHPQVEQAMNEVGGTRQYKELVGHFKAIPFAKSDFINIDQYVVPKSFDGLFLVLGQEKQKIQLNHDACVTDLLKKGFSHSAS